MENIGDRFILTVLFLFTVFIVSCNKTREATSMSIQSEIVKCDSIIYYLPKETEQELIKMLQDKNVVYCDLVSTGLNKYSFSFPYINNEMKNNFVKKLLEKTNTYLKVEDRFYPLLNWTDYIFSEVRDSVVYAEHNKSCIIEVDSNGKLITGFVQ